MADDDTLPDAPQPAHKFPKWAPQIGVAFLGVTVLFLMALVFATVVFQKSVPDEGRFLIVAILALTMAAGSAFLGGSAVASGKLPIGGSSSNPMAYSLTGGVVVFAFVLILGMQVFPAAGGKAEPDPGLVITDTTTLPSPQAVIGEPPPAAPLAGQPDWTAQPSYATIGLTAGFTPDPHMQLVRAGGAMHVVVGGSCSGWIHQAAPDVRLDYASGTFPLILAARAQVDVMLVVRTPDGQWHCNDDYQGAMPLLYFGPALSGTYHIWVGTYAAPADGLPEAALLVSEAFPGS